MNRPRNHAGLVLFICIILVLLFIIVAWFFNISLEEPRKSSEGFYAKRNERIKIYQSDEICDPDEAPEYDEKDPDDNPRLYDPDQQPMLNDEEVGNINKKRTPKKQFYKYNN
jgi:hypothetical protein